MSTPARIGGFVAVLAVLFGAAFGIGKLWDDDGGPAAYRVDLRTSTTDGRTAIRFAVLDPEGTKVTRFAVRHEKRLHLILVRKDLDVFRHLHPTMSPSGEWSIDAPLPGGDWRLFADFQPTGGTNEVIDRDFTVSGDPTVPALEQPYQVKLSGKLAAGGDGSMLRFTVTRHGKPVTLQPYLGAFGHLVVLREKDLEYLHVHPAMSAPTAPIPFHVEVPASGRYRLFLDYQVGGVVHTASFRLDAAEGADDMGGMGGMDHGDH